MDALDGSLEFYLPVIPLYTGISYCKEKTESSHNSKVNSTFSLHGGSTLVWAPFNLEVLSGKRERSIRSSSHRRNSGVIVLYCWGADGGDGPG